MAEFASSTWMHRTINKQKQQRKTKHSCDFNLPRVSKNDGISNKFQRKVAKVAKRNDNESRTQRECAAANSND